MAATVASCCAAADVDRFSSEEPHPVLYGFYDHFVSNRQEMLKLHCTFELPLRQIVKRRRKRNLIFSRRSEISTSGLSITQTGRDDERAARPGLQIGSTPALWSSGESAETPLHPGENPAVDGQGSCRWP